MPAAARVSEMSVQHPHVKEQNHGIVIYEQNHGTHFFTRRVYIVCTRMIATDYLAQNNRNKKKEVQGLPYLVVLILW
jgi:hypothetical protein